MHESTLAKRYAIALADLAAEQGILDAVGEQLAAFKAVVEVTPSLRNLLVSPTSSTKEQHAVVGAFLDHSETAPITVNFLRLLVDKRRMPILDDIVVAYARNVEQRSGVVAATVRTPMMLTDEQAARLGGILSGAVNREVHLAKETDPALLGGMVVQIGSVMMDYSIRSQLNRLKAYMRG